MTVFKIKTSDEKIFNDYQKGRDILKIDHLIQYEDEIDIDAPVLLLFGGDNRPWVNGLYAIAKIISKPLELGYETALRGRYYKLKIEIVLRLDTVFEKSDFICYPESFDSGVGPSTKGERNQALGTIDDKGTPKTIASICRALLDENPKYEKKLRSVFGKKIIDYAIQQSIVYAPLHKTEPQSVDLPLFQSHVITKKPVQTIYYGVPGCGKSHRIKIELKKRGITEENGQLKRVVFHPDYSNADFVGQILPVTKKDGGIRYQFKAGPFTKILRDAYQNPEKEYALIIEEINRGNAAAIFGDLFQLLDRKRDPKTVETVNGNSYGPGWSDYCVENDYINAYFRGAYDTDETPSPLPEKKLGNITFNDNVDIRLPPNLSLYATMNTSDQNVFSLDNAFQRRWEMKLVSNDLKNDDDHADEKEQYNQTIGNTGVKWGIFREKINDIIMQSAEENGLSSMEDKRLGGWFITPNDSVYSGDTKISDEAFAEKVLKYLWDDAFKFDRPKHFDEIKTLEDLTKKFKIDGFNIFKDESISKLNQQNGTTDAQTGTPET